MIDRTVTYFLEQPRRMVEWGQGASFVGGLLLVIGLIARVFVLVTSFGPVRAGVVGGQVTLSEVFPSWPTWFVPEGPIGYALAVALLGAGLWLNFTGKRYLRYLRGA